MRYYIIAGERSGDLHASNLIRSLQEQDPEATLRGWGGDYMENAGCELVRHYKDLAFMGFTEVLLHLNTFRKALQACKDDIQQWQPDVVILVDFSGFNLRIARFVKTLGIPVFYYISPKIWAWNQKRVHMIRAVVDRMFVILPFEKDFYGSFDYNVDYVGNPLCDAIRQFEPNPNFREENGLDERPIIAVLPGSRAQEIERTIHFMVSVLPPFMDYQFVIAAVTSLPRSVYEPWRRNNIRVVYDQTYDLLSQADVAMVTSGTATLETAMFNVPQVVCYKSSYPTYLIAKALIKVDYISLVNLIAGREVVKELIQDEFTPSNLMKELDRLLKNETYRQRVLEGYADIREKLGPPGASEKAARLMISYLKEPETIEN
ncbi:lipid-A-disaccharide synthase [Catalinimonas alkaloidigena]|uniref:Lipid-A-disaccharide synthase n=1 Tax=Catalinimonas alkaloidigena TaxID=1075417 RepID=A0A1G9GWM3_9BACT|nr:lipid-A-disaccharide synthase [Catalinimonas alkaloidigena]SDL04984.1 lipid-A-disaccharide synthase [Catalinimonas alkaloidigena]